MHSSRQAGKEETESAVLFFFGNHFPRDTGHVYVDVAPSATCLLVKERAQESTVRAQGCTAQENEPQSARRALPQLELWMSCPCVVCISSVPVGSRSDATSVHVNFRERSLKQEHQ